MSPEELLKLEFKYLMCRLFGKMNLHNWCKARHPPYQPKFLQVLAANLIIKNNINYDSLPPSLYRMLKKWRYTECSWCGTDRDDYCIHGDRCFFCCLDDVVVDDSSTDEEDFNSSSYDDASSSDSTF